jgi:hypothetical protein
MKNEKFHKSIPTDSQADVQSLHKIDGTSLLLTRMVSIRDEVVGEACSLWIPKTVVDLST